MSSITIKNNQGKAFGKLVTYPGGRIYAQTMSGQTKGYYDPAFDRTYTNEGRVISTGNTAAALLV